MSDAHEINEIENQCVQLINPPMDNVGIVCSGAGGGSKYIYSIYIACV